MKTQYVAALAALATVAAVPAFAQTPPPAPTPAPAGGLSVDKTTIGALMADEKAKAVLLADLPAIAPYVDQVKDMTLAQLAPMSQGAIDNAKLKQIQADLDNR
jgi:hypothetical protein